MKRYRFELEGCAQDFARVREPQTYATSMGASIYITSVTAMGGSVVSARSTGAHYDSVYAALVAVSGKH